MNVKPIEKCLHVVALCVLCAPSGFAADASGIKAANIKGAKLELMNNHDPAVAHANFILREGFAINLFSSEPDVANPIHLTWDAAGRLYVACSWAYPQLKPGAVANDKIITLEDTNNDGVADKTTVFADGLYIPTGIETANGGVYVAQTPDILFLKDTDGDGVADLREVVLTGFGIEDSHHSISAWRRGPGGWIYFQEGIFLHTQVETPHGMVRNYNGGVYQYNPMSQELRVFANIGVGNPWGHVFDRWGQSFLVDNPRVIYVTPGSGNGDKKNRLQALMSTEKQCGGDLVTGTHFPDAMRGQMLSCRFKSRKIVPYEFTEKESGFSATVHAPLVASSHPNFRPVDCKIGPDGALYIADWYNPIINHAQHDFRDTRRDFQHGRIWRVTAKDRPLVKKPDLLGASITGLLDHLKSDNTWTRHHARLTLSEKEPDAVAAATRDWMRKQDDAHDLLEGLWTLQGVHRPDPVSLQLVLGAKDGRARAAGTRLIRYWHASLPDPVALVARMANDPHPRVRMEAVLAAGFVLDAKALPAALQALDHPRDKNIDLAFAQTIAALRPLWEPALVQGALRFAKPGHEAFLGAQAGTGTDVLLKNVLKKGQATPAELAGLRRQMLAKPSNKQQKLVADTLVKRGHQLQPELAEMLFDVLAEIGRRRPFGLGKGMDRLTKYLGSDAPELVEGSMRVLGNWQRTPTSPALVNVMKNVKHAFETRRIAAEALGTMGRSEALKPLEDMAAGDQPLKDRYLALFGLVAHELENSAALTAEVFSQDPANNQVVALVKAFTARAGGANTLAAALDGKDIHPQVRERLAVEVRNAGPFPGKLGRIFSSGSEGSIHHRLVREERAKLVADVDGMGDPLRGEQVYRRSEVACMSCHAINGAGPKLGPDLAAVGAAATTEYVVESILEPNAAIAEHYENTSVITADNMFRMGVITFKSDAEIVLRDMTQGGKEIRIPKDQVKKMNPMPSLMPAGLAGQLSSRQEFLDLAHFVSRLGRAGAYASSDAPVVRTWTREDGATLFTMVNGLLPAAHLAPQLSAQVDVQKAGAVGLDLNDSRGLSLQVNGQPVADLTRPLDLPTGRVTLEFTVDTSARKQPGLRLELKPLPGSEARFRVVN